MKLLIVDDEYFSRENIKESLSWDKYGIDEIKEADDGVNALAICKNYEPDIVLTDVRMPRMDGINLAFKLREMFPDCAIIFISGYSDKEYLKSAIKLKAISYVEKPIYEDEMIEAVKAAVNWCAQNAFKKHQKVGNLFWIRFQLALQLMDKNIDLQKIKSLSTEAEVRLPIDGYFTTVVIKLYTNDAFAPNDYNMLDDFIFSSIQKACKEVGINAIWTMKENYFIIHTYSSISDRSIFMQEKIQHLCRLISNNLSMRNIIFTIGIGQTVVKLINVYKSYETAVQSLNQAFFGESGSIYYYKPKYTKPFIFSQNMIEEFSRNLIDVSSEHAISFVQKLVTTIKNYDNITEDYVKSFYAKLLRELFRISKERHVDVFADFADEYELYQYISTISFLDDLNSFLLNRIITYFDLLNKKVDNNGPVDLIIQYIYRNYQDKNLCLTMISEKINLAPTYICFVFKKRTGKTLNQYITEYRIKKAKELLKDKTIKVSDISSMVGYYDSNYFAKLFKKYVGVSPSDYRRNLQL